MKWFSNAVRHEITRCDTSREIHTFDFDKFIDMKMVPRTKTACTHLIPSRMYFFSLFALPLMLIEFSLYFFLSVACGAHPVVITLFAPHPIRPFPAHSSTDALASPPLTVLELPFLGIFHLLSLLLPFSLPITYLLFLFLSLFVPL